MTRNVFQRLSSGMGVFLEVCRADSNRAYQRALLALAVSLTACVAVRLATGCLPLVSYPNDSVLALALGNRLADGQRPHTDFYCPLGVVPLLVTLLGIHVAGLRGLALTVGIVCLAPLLAAGAWWLARARLSALFCWGYALLLVVLLCGTTNLGEDFVRTTYAMQYNRIGYAIYGLVLAGALVPPRSPLTTSRRNLEGMAVGACLCLLFFLKINFFLAALSAVAVGVFLGSQPLRQLVATFCGFAAMLVLLGSYLRFDVASYFSDLNTLSKVHSSTILVKTVVVNLLDPQPPVLACLAALFVFALPLSRSILLSPEFRTATVGVVVVLSLGAAVSTANWQPNLRPLLPVAGILVFEMVARTSLEKHESQDSLCLRERFRGFFCASVALALLAGLIAPNLAGMAHAWSVKKQCRNGSLPYATLQSETLADFWFPEAPQESTSPEDSEAAILDQQTGLSPIRLAKFLNDGIALLRTYADSNDVLFVLDANDLFTVALGLSHNHGDVSWYHWERTTSDTAHPDPDDVLARVTLAMKPKRYLDPNTGNAMDRIYFPAIQRDFERIGESKYWVLYSKDRRRNGR